MSKVKFYCETCSGYEPIIYRPAIFESLQKDSEGKVIPGDILCKECHFVIASFSADEPGEYEIVKVQK